MAELGPLPHEPWQVRAELQKRIDALLPRLGITDLPKGGMVTPLNPTRSDRTRGSFVIWTSGDAVGGWKDYATGDKGDVFDLIQYTLKLARWIDAYWEALDFLGWGRGEVRRQSQTDEERARAERDRKAAEARRGAEEDKVAAKAKGFWLAMAPDLVGTVAWTYLTEARGLPMDKLRKPPGALRFCPNLDYVDRETGEVSEHPAMVSAMSHWNDGQVRAVHRTYLAADGRGKADVPVAKKMMGVAKGCAIRVWKGAGDKSPEAAARAGETSPLVITEGIEDAITAAIAQPAYRVWAAGSLSLLGSLGWPDCASAVVLVADNDWDKPQAVAAFERVHAHWQGMAHGRTLKVVRAETGKDLNDWARGET